MGRAWGGTQLSSNPQDPVRARKEHSWTLAHMAPVPGLPVAQGPGIPHNPMWLPCVRDKSSEFRSP